MEKQPRDLALEPQFSSCWCNVNINWSKQPRVLAGLLASQLTKTTVTHSTTNYKYKIKPTDSVLSYI